MKALLFLFLPLSLQAANLTLAWDHPDPTNVVSYSLFYGTNSGIYTSSLVVTGLQASVTLSPGPWFFAATASERNGLASEFSEELSVVVTNAPPVVTNQPPASLTNLLRIISYVQTIRDGESSWHNATSFLSQTRIKSGVPFRSETYVEVFKPDQLRLSVYIQQQLPVTLGWVNSTNYLHTSIMESNVSFRTLSFTESIPLP